MRILLPLLAVLALFAQEPPAGAPGQKKAPMPHKNLKILTDDEVRPMMGAFRTALGVECTGCHVQGNFASDDNPKKDVARTMIAMVRDMNSKYLAGKTQVTCYTCHRGAEEPKTVPDPKAE